MAWFSLPKKEASTPHPARPLTFHNTLGDADQKFEHNTKTPVRMYNCGPTVYGPAHIGNLRSYILADILRRTLQYNGFLIKQVINITDVGHLTSDADAGEDKMSKGLRREGLDLSLENMHTLAEKYAGLFMHDLAALSIETSDTEFPRASAYIEAMVALIKTLDEKGYTYTTSDGVYFDTSKFAEYGKLGNIDIDALKEGARVEANDEKRNPADFALWKLNETLGWNSPWGTGFPGWHIECSAMARSCLGEQIDIHTGGIDHIPVHHNNEIAQSESATGKKPFSKFWLHNAHISVGDEKISKSLGNDIHLATLPEHGIHPLALRYLYLGARYSSPMNFSWESLESAQLALLRLHFIFDTLEKAPGASVSVQFQKRFHECINNDLDTAGALAVMWEMLRDKAVGPGVMYATLLDFDYVLGLRLGNADAQLKDLLRAQFGEVVPNENLSENVRALLTVREQAREAKDWPQADSLRDQILALGYTIEDTPAGARVLQK